MKKRILSLTLTAAIVSAYGQGTVFFSNSAINRQSIKHGNESVAVPTTPGLLKYGLWYGVGSASAVNSNAAPWIIGVNSVTGVGLIASSADGTTPLYNVLLGPETSFNEDDVWVQVIGWSAQYSDWQSAQAAWLSGTPGVLVAMTDVRNIAGLGSPAVAGVAIWQPATGTNPRRLNALEFNEGIPEPTTIALAGLGTLALLVARRRR